MWTKYGSIRYLNITLNIIILYFGFKIVCIDIQCREIMNRSKSLQKKNEFEIKFSSAMTLIFYLNCYFKLKATAKEQTLSGLP